MTIMDDLTAFITARLDEDEVIAKAAANRHWRTDDNIITLHPEHDGDGFMSWPTRADAQHAAHHDPARALREIAAKRAIVTGHSWFSPTIGPNAGKPCCTRCGAGLDDVYLTEPWPCDDLRILAAVWSDHPDYKQEWAL